MDLNPVKILPPGRGCVAVDARIRLANPRRAGLLSARRPTVSMSMPEL
jgi:hypothetical protein